MTSRTRRTLACAVAVCSAAAVLSAQQPAAPQTAAGATGTWTIDGTPWSIVLKQEGQTLSGKVVQGVQEFPITDGKIEGSMVSFKASVPTGERTITFVGRLAGDDIEFKRTVEIKDGGAAGGNALMGGPGGPAEFKAQRSSPDTDVWTGSIRNAPTPQNANPNPNVRPVTVAMRKFPDPHWRWRGGSKELPMRVVTVANNPIPLSTFVLEGDRLMFTYTRPGPEDTATCSLARQPDGIFSGACRAEGNGFNVFITLTPPKEAAKRP